MSSVYLQDSAKRRLAVPRPPITDVIFELLCVPINDLKLELRVGMDFSIPFDAEYASRLNGNA